MSVEDYGTVNLYISWQSILGVFLTFNLVGGVINNGMHDFKSDSNAFIKSAMGLALLTTFFGSLLYIIFYFLGFTFISLESKYMLLIFLTSISNCSFGIWALKERYQFKFKKVALISILIAISNPIFSFYFIFFTDFNDAYAKVLGYVLPNIIFYSLITISIILSKGTLYNKKYWKYIIAFNLPLIPHYLSYIILAQSDRIIIEYYLGNKYVALYSLAYSIGSVSLVLFGSINSSLIPYIYQKLEIEEYQSIFNSSKRIIIIAVVWSCLFILFAPEFIRILGTTEYYSSVSIVSPVVLGVFLVFIYTLFANIQFYYKKTIWIMIASVFTAVLNIVLNIIFIEYFGIIAAAYTTLLSYVALTLIHYFLMKKLIVNLIYDCRFIIIQFAILIFISVYASVFSELILARICWMIVMIVVYYKKYLNIKEKLV